MRVDANDALTSDEITRLASLLESETLPPDSMDVWELLGFLTAIASAPSAMMPSSWLPALYGDDRSFADGDEARGTNDLAVRLFNQISDALQRGEAFQPFGPPSRDDAPKWAQGYVSGARLDAKWRSDDMGAALLFPLGVLAGMFDLSGQSNEEEDPIEDPTTYEDRFYEGLGRATLALHRYWRPQRTSLAGPRRLRVPRSNTCLCGSGVPFERCCGRRTVS